jgi:Kef-type K+ transport system membrane component KefB
MRITGFSKGEGLVAGLMTVPQLSATLAAAAIGKDMGILEPRFFNTIIVLSIVTTLPIPSIVRLLVERLKLKDRIAKYETPLVVENEEML